MFPPMANPNLEITAADFERLVRDWIVIIEGAATYETRSAFPVATQPPAWLNLPKFALWHVGENDAGSISMKSLGRANTEINEMFS